MSSRKRSGFYLIQLLFFFILIIVGIFTSVIDNPKPASASSAKPLSTTTSSTPKMVSNASNVPKLGTPLKFGMYTDDPNPSSINTKLGHQINIMAWFVHWNDNMNSQKLSSACNQGYVPLITWESWDGVNISANPYPLSAIASGEYDQLIKSQLNEIKSVCANQTVIIRFDHEMDTPVGTIGWYPWQGNPSEYIAAWQHVVILGRQIDPNIKWLWSPNRGTQTTKEYYPGDKWVDYVGLTLNHGILESQYSTFAQFYQANQQVIESFNKPVIISETTSDETVFANKAAWVSSMFAFVESDPRITALSWFNGSPGYSYDSSPSTLAAFKQALSSLPRD